MSNMLNNLPRWLTPDEAAARLRVPKTRIYRMTSERTIPFFKLGRVLRFDAAALDAWVQAKAKAPIE